MTLLFCLLVSSVAFAQDELAQPLDLPHPETGEAGTWIPRWVEREHVIDAHKLTQCLEDLQMDGELIVELEVRGASLEKAIEAKDQALITSLEATTSLAQLATDRALLERRTRIAWILTGISLAFAGVTTTLVLTLP